MGAITKECTVENYKTKEGKLITWQGDVHNDKADCDDRVSEWRQSTRFHLWDRWGSTERPLIRHEEKTQTHDTLPKSLLSGSAEIVGSKLLVRDYDGIHMGGLCYELAQRFPTPFSWDRFCQETFLYNAMQQNVLCWTIFHLTKHLKNSTT